MSDVISQFQGSYIQTLNDPIQTHALYGVLTSDITNAKLALSQQGATRFRVVKNSYGFAIICFKI